MKVKKAPGEKTNKQLAIQAIRKLPEGASMRQIVAEMALLESFRQAEADIEAGRFITHEELKQRVETWRSK
jgi:predicted transcriptional regulator